MLVNGFKNGMMHGLLEHADEIETVVGRAPGDALVVLADDGHVDEGVVDGRKPVSQDEEGDGDNNRGRENPGEAGTQHKCGGESAFENHREKNNKESEAAEADKNGSK